MLCLFFSSARAADRADFLVIDDPARLSLYNQYQESYSADDLKRLPLRMPVRVLNEASTLGDQITPVFKGLYGTAVIFIQKDEVGRFKGLAQKPLILKGCVLLGDTVEIVPGAKIRLCSARPCNSDAEEAAAGIKLMRIFEKEGWSLVRSPGRDDAFFWARMTPGVIRKAQSILIPADTALTDPTLKQIRERLETANRAYVLWFGHFNGVTRQDLSIPRWNLERGPGAFRCVLQGPPHYRESLARSTARLVQDIDGLLIGRPFQARLDRGDIVVETKTFTPRRR